MLQQYIQQNPNAYKSILAYNSNLRSTSAYWYVRYRELLDMVKTCGPPTVFLTLSAADLYWPELYQILDPGFDYNQLTDRSAMQRRNRLLNENPLKVAYFFQKRAELFLLKCFNQKFKVKDYWWRIEFQPRGSPHVHGLFLFENALSILNLTSQDTERLNQIKIYFDEILSTWHPNPCVIYDTQ